MNLSRYKSFLPFALFLIFLTLYFSNQRQLSHVTLTTVNSVYYADTSETADIMTYPTFNMDATKHPLFSVTCYPLVWALTHCLGLARDNAVLAVISFFGAVNVLLSYYVFGFFIKDIKTVLIFSVLYGVFFSNLVLASIPETYVLSELMILIYVFFARRFALYPGYFNNIALSAVTGLSSLYNPPLLLLLAATGYVSFSNNGFSRALRLFSVNVLVVLWIFLGMNLLVHRNYFYICAIIIQQNASLSNFLRIYNYLNVIFSFILYAVVSPQGTVKDVIGVPDVKNYFTSPLRLGLILTYLSFLAVSLKNAFTGRHALIAGLLAWMLCMILFYVYFNPGEAMLYSSQTLLPLLLTMGVAFENITYRYKYRVAVSFAVLLFINNCVSLIKMKYGA